MSVGADKLRGGATNFVHSLSLIHILCRDKKFMGKSMSDGIDELL